MSNTYDSLTTCCNLKPTTLAIIFEGNIHDSYALWYVLSETDHEVIVYCPYPESDEDQIHSDKVIIASHNLQLLKNYQTSIRDFILVKTKLAIDDGVGPHIERHSPAQVLLSFLDFHKQNKNVDQGTFDTCLILNDANSFQNPAHAFDFNKALLQHNFPFSVKTPFATTDRNQITIEAIQEGLYYEDINFGKIFLDHKLFFKAITAVLDNNLPLNEVDKIAQMHQKFFNEIFLCSAFQCQYQYNIFLLRYFQSDIDKELILHTLSHMGIFTPDKEEIISLCLAVSQASKKEISEIGTSIINQLRNPDYAQNILYVHKAKEISKFFNHEIDEHTIYLLLSEDFFMNADFFLRAFGMSSQETLEDVALDLLQTLDFDLFNPSFTPIPLENLRDCAVEKIEQYAYQLHNHFLILLFKRLVHQGADIGEILFRSIQYLGHEASTDCIDYLLEQFHDHLHPLQLNDALLEAFAIGHYPLCDKLIANNADQSVIQYHKISYTLPIIYEHIKDIHPTWRINEAVLPKDIYFIKALLESLGRPQDKVPAVFHVTGSNGKGSVCTNIRSILEHNDYQVHCFTTPWIIKDTECFIVSNEEISEAMFYEYLKKVSVEFNKFIHSKDFFNLLLQLGISESDNNLDGFHPLNLIIPAMLLAFADHPADATIIEVFVGGEHDVTNVFDSAHTAATIVNNIFQNDNHSQIGSFRTIESRAQTKAKLSKPNVPIVSAAQESAVQEVIKEIADAQRSSLFICGKDFTVQSVNKDQFSYNGFGKSFILNKPQMTGDYQINNAAIALSAILCADKDFKLTEAKVSEGIYNAIQIGRMARVNDIPCFKNLLSIFPKDTPKLYSGTVKDKKGLSDFLETMKQLYHDKSFTFVINLPSTSERVISALEHIYSYDLNIQSISIYNTLSPQDDIILKYRTQNYQKKIIAIKRSLSGAIMCHDLKQSEVFCILSFGVQIFPKRFIPLLQDNRQKHYLADLKFANSYFRDNPDVQYLSKLEK